MRITRSIYWNTDLVTVDDWLYRMWGIQSGQSSPSSGGQRTFLYPAAVAQWLYAIWGITVPVDDTGARFWTAAADQPASGNDACVTSVPGNETAAQPEPMVTRP